MKTNTLLLSLLLLIATSSFAQNFTNKIVLNKGQKFSTSSTTTGTTSMEMMGQSMETVIESNGSGTIEVKEVTPTSYKLTTTMNKIKVKSKGMGQENTFDSEKKEDVNSEMGQALKEQLKPRDEEISFAGKNLANKNNAGEEESIQKAMQALNGADNGAEGNFILIPSGKKAGDKWTDSSNAEGLKVYNTYTLQQLNGTDATVLVNTVTNIDKNVKAQGADVNIKMDMKATTTNLVDVTTGLIKEKKIVAEGKGNINAGGQEMPMTSKVTTTTTIKSL